MIGWVLAAFATGCFISEAKHSKELERRNENLTYYNVYLSVQNTYLQNENQYLRITIDNVKNLLRNYDIVNSYAKSLGYKGAVDFFYYLADNHDSRFIHFARFLNKARHIRNDVAHEGLIYDVDSSFLNNLELCVRICEAYNSLPYGQTLSLDY